MGDSELAWQPTLQEFDPDAEVAIYNRNLPHWRQEGTTYFITFRLADSLPKAKIDQLLHERNEWLRSSLRGVYRNAQQRRLAYSLWFSGRIESFLAAGYGECWLARPTITDIVQDALQFFHRQRYHLGRYVIMPNHVHALVTPTTHDVAKVLHSWKSFTANKINKLLGRTGTFWQDEYYDHLVRNGDELLGYEQYISANPRTAGLPEGVYRLGSGDDS